jgi:VanZ family protein
VTGRRAAVLTGSLVLVGLALVSLGPVPQPDLPGLFESLPHVVAYAVGTWVALTVITGGRRDPLRSRVVAIVAGSMIALGVVLELAQRAVGRDVEVADALANASGVFVAVVAYGLVHRIGRSTTVRGR